MKRIILRDWEASAFYAGRLTQLRRLVEPQPEYGRAFWGGALDDVNVFRTRNKTGGWHHCDPITFAEIYCPLGGVGSRLWVAEAFKFWCHSFESVGVEYVAGGDDKIVDFEDGWDMPSLEVQTRNGLDGSRLKRSPSTMPRWASRSIIELTAVRVKRVQEVTEDEAQACGSDRVLMPDRGVIATPVDYEDELNCRFKNGFQFQWECDHGQASWDANPWVWVYDVRRVEK